MKSEYMANMTEDQASSGTLGEEKGKIKELIEKFKN
jgi:hypothetical protein